METSVQAASSAHRSNTYVLVEGPPWGDAEFLGKWLLAAAQAEGFWTEAYNDAAFQKQVECVGTSYIPDFGITASIIVMHLKEYRTTFVFDVNSEDGEDFTMMVAMGFFVFTGEHYKMALPSELTAAKVRAAVLNYAMTEDDEFMLHPEHIVRTMTFVEAAALQDRLRAIDQFHCNFQALGRA